MPGPRSTPDADVAIEEVQRGIPPLQRSGSGYLWIVQRLALGLVVLLLVSVLVFVATQGLPSDPARAILGRAATPQQLDNLREQYGLNHSIPTQYWDWFSGVLNGDLGTSLVGRSDVSGGHVSGNSVASLVVPRLESSLSLLAIVALISIPASILMGAITAVRRDGLFDRGTLLASLGLTAVPEFVIGMALVVIFATTVFEWLPAVAIMPPGASPFAHPREMALPVTTLVLACVPYLYRLVRASMIDVLDSEFVTMARLKGMPERTVLLRHALPNALVPVIQASSLILAYLLGGIVVVEFLFRFPGLGSLLTESIANRDLPVIQATVLAFAAGVVFFNLVADFLTVLVTPKLRTDASRR